MNASVGQPDGFPKIVTGIDSISSVGYGPPLGFNSDTPPSVQCYETVTYNDGSKQTGSVDIINETDGLAVTWTPQPPPVSPQQEARAILAAEKFQSDEAECSREYNEKIGEMSNLSLEAQAGGTAFDSGVYLKDAGAALASCQQAASQEYNSVVSSSPE